MTIKTKFNTGDDVWFMHGNKPVHNKIEYIRIFTVHGGQISIMYEFLVPFKIEFYEHEVFKNKKDLLDSL